MFDITVSDDGILRLSGRLDASESERALSLLGAVEGSTTADLSELTYISSAGLAVILATYKRLLDAGHTFRVVNPAPRVAAVFRYAGLDKLLGIVEAR